MKIGEPWLFVWPFQCINCRGRIFSMKRMQWESLAQGESLALLVLATAILEIGENLGRISFSLTQYTKNWGSSYPQNYCYFLWSLDTSSAFASFSLALVSMWMCPKKGVLFLLFGVLINIILSFGVCPAAADFHFLLKRTLKRPDQRCLAFSPFFPCIFFERRKQQ